MRIWVATVLALATVAGVKRSALKYKLTSSRTPAACSAAVDALSPLRTPKEFGLAIGACGRCNLPGRSLALLREMPEPDRLAYNGVISSLARVGRWRIALRLFDEMVRAPTLQPDEWSLNTVLNALVKGKQPLRAHSLLQRAGTYGVRPDEVAFRTVLTGLARAKKFDMAVDTLVALRHEAPRDAGMKQGGERPTPSRRIDAPTYSIAAQASSLGPVDRELALIETLRARGTSPDRACYLAAALACKASANATAAVALLAQHEAETALAPDEAFLAAIIGACGNARAWDLQWRAHERAEALGLRMDVVSRTVVLNGCAQSGNWVRASKLVRELLARPDGAAEGAVQPDVAMYSAAISCCEAAGRWREALQLIERMIAAGIEPDAGCFTAALQAVGAAGMIEEGMSLLRSMHAGACTPRCLAQSYPAHRVMLEACRRAKEDAAIDEIQSLIEAAGLSSLAAEADLAPKRRRSTRATFANDQSSPKLMQGVRDLSRKLAQRVGYQPQYDALPPSFLKRSSRKQRDASLLRHAEKQALVDQLQRGKSELSLSINFHVCVDCHAFLRAASRDLQRTITVREPKLVHTFTDGQCSCGERWRWETRRVVGK